MGVFEIIIISFLSLNFMEWMGFNIFEEMDMFICEFTFSCCISIRIFYGGYYGGGKTGV